MPYTAPSSSTTLTERPEPAHHRPHLATLHGRHRSEPSLTLTGHTTSRIHLSSSYIHRHRRSPSLRASLPVYSPETEPSIRFANNGASNVNHGSWKPNQPSTTLVPSVLSPPESRQNSSDEDDKKEVGTMALAELHAAILSMEHPSGHPSMTKPGSPELSPSAELALMVAEPRRKPPTIELPPLRPQSIDGSIMRQLPETAVQTPDQSDREDDEARPPMIRKKSGELVRPALRMKRPSSMPGTPTFVKNVHFDVQLEQVRHFLQVDMPVAVSARSSPADEYDGDTEFPFGSNSLPKSSKHFHWEAKITNYQVSTEGRPRGPIFLEKLMLSADNKFLVGIVAVENIAFHKHVAARFTLDHWKTVSEVEAEYNHNPHEPKPKGLGHRFDRFHFNIRLSDLADLETKTMFVCLRYRVNGHEFWDNNEARNYHVKFIKTHKAPGAAGLHARNHRHIPRPHSMPPMAGEVPFQPARSFQSPQDEGFGRLMGQVPLPHAEDDILEAPTKRTKPAQAFATRYDFGSSLSAAMQPGALDLAQPGVPTSKHFASVNKTATENRGSNAPELAAEPREMPGPSNLLFAKPCHQSAGYQELVDKYCFYETNPSPTKVRSRPAERKAATEQEPPSTQPKPLFSETNIFASPESSPTSEKPSLPMAVLSPRSRSPSNPRSDLASNGPSPLFPPFHQAIPPRILSESPTPTAIRG